MAKLWYDQFRLIGTLVDSLGFTKALYSCPLCHSLVQADDIHNHIEYHGRIESE